MSGMKKLPLLGLVFLLSACAASDKLGWTHKNYDVAILASPITLRPLTGPVAVDAVEKGETDAEQAQAVIVFKIDRVTQGEMPLVKIGGPSKTDQMAEAYRNKEYLKLFTMDFEDPDRQVPKDWISIAVLDPEASFGIRPGDNLDESTRQYRIYLKKEKGRARNFIFVRAEPK